MSSSYTQAIKVGKWTQTTSIQDSKSATPLKSVCFYSKKIGTSGYGGCSFYEMKPTELTNLIHYFNKCNIPYLEFSNELNYGDEDVWWSYSEYHHNTNETNEKTNTLIGKYPICSAGYRFILTKSAYQRLCNAKQ